VFRCTAPAFYFEERPWQQRWETTLARKGERAAFAAFANIEQDVAQLPSGAVDSSGTLRSTTGERFTIQRHTAGGEQRERQPDQPSHRGSDIAHGLVTFGTSVTGNNLFVTFTASAVPRPASVALVGLGGYRTASPSPPGLRKLESVKEGFSASD